MISTARVSELGAHDSISGIPWTIFIKHILSLTVEKAMAPHSSPLAWKNQWTEEPGSSPWGRQESDTTERLHFHFHALEKEMATHSSVLAWRIPGTGEPGGLPSMGSHRVRHNWSDLAAASLTDNLHWAYTDVLEYFSWKYMDSQN